MIMYVELSFRKVFHSLKLTDHSVVTMNSLWGVLQNIWEKIKQLNDRQKQIKC